MPRVKVLMNETTSPEFGVRYLGCEWTAVPVGAGCATEPVFKVWSRFTKVKRIKTRLQISERGMTLYDSNKLVDHWNIERISYCTAETEVDPRLFCWIFQVPDELLQATEKKSKFQCHVVLCSTEEKARLVAFCLKRAFNLAYSEYCRSRHSNDSRDDNHKRRPSQAAAALDKPLLESTAKQTTDKRSESKAPVGILINKADASIPGAKLATKSSPDQSMSCTCSLPENTNVPLSLSRQSLNHPTSSCSTSSRTTQSLSRSSAAPFLEALRQSDELQSYTQGSGTSKDSWFKANEKTGIMRSASTRPHRSLTDPSLVPRVPLRDLNVRPISSATDPGVIAQGHTIRSTSDISAAGYLHYPLASTIPFPTGHEVHQDFDKPSCDTDL